MKPISMRLAVMGCLLLMPAVSLADGPHKPPRSARHAYRQAVDELEEQWRAAMLKHDSAALGLLLSDDYIGIDSNGTLQTKDDAITAVKTGALHLDSLEVLEHKVRLYGTTALVTTHAEVAGTVNGTAIHGRYRYTRVYVRSSDGRWKIVSFEVNRVDNHADSHQD